MRELHTQNDMDDWKETTKSSELEIVDGNEADIFLLPT